MSPFSHTVSTELHTSLNEIPYHFRVEVSISNEAFISELKKMKAEIIDLKRKNFKYGLVFRGKGVPRNCKNWKKTMTGLIYKQFGIRVKEHEISDAHPIKKGVLVEWNDRTEGSSYR